MSGPDDYYHQEYDDCGCVSCWDENPDRDEDGDIINEPDAFFHCHEHGEMEEGDRQHHAIKDMED